MDALRELRELIDAHAVAGKPETAIDGVRLIRTSGSLPAAKVVYEPVFCVVAQGAKRVIVGDKVLTYDTGKYLIVSVDLPVTGQVVVKRADEPYLAFTLKIDRGALASVLLDMAQAPDDETPTAGMAVSPVTPDLLDPVIRLVRLIGEPRHAAMLAPLAEKEILYRLLTGAQGPMLRQIAFVDSRLSRISRTIDWIKQNYSDGLRIETMAEIAGMSAASFHRHFKAVTAMSPLQFQKQIRLQEARRLILSERIDTGRIGFAVGYESASQFSREYSRLFGAPPARDAARLRDLAAAAPESLTQTV